MTKVSTASSPRHAQQLIRLCAQMLLRMAEMQALLADYAVHMETASGPLHPFPLEKYQRYTTQMLVQIERLLDYWQAWEKERAGG